MSDLFLTQGARFSPCGAWRYRLWSIYEKAKPTLGYVGVNPSTAGRPGAFWDLTARKFDGFARGNGFGGWVACNLFGLVSTDPKGLRAFDGDPVGVDNDAHMIDMANACSRVVVCWGATGGVYEERVRRVEGLLSGADLWCLGRTKAGHPRHPSRLPYATPMEPYAVEGRDR